MSGFSFGTNIKPEVEETSKEKDSDGGRSSEGTSIKDNSSTGNEIKTSTPVSVETEQMVAEFAGIIPLKFKKLHDNAVLPSYAKTGDACMDITAIDCVYDAKRDCFVYHSGFAVEIPVGYEIQIRPRSSNRNTNAFMTNSPGTIDSGYRGEVLVCFKNRDISITTAPYQVGDRIAQMKLSVCPKAAPMWVDELSDSERGTGGHGSTGN